MPARPASRMKARKLEIWNFAGKLELWKGDSTGAQIVEEWGCEYNFEIYLCQLRNWVGSQEIQSRNFIQTVQEL